MRKGKDFFCLQCPTPPLKNYVGQSGKLSGPTRYYFSPLIFFLPNQMPFAYLFPLIFLSTPSLLSTQPNKTLIIFGMNNNISFIPNILGHNRIT